MKPVPFPHAAHARLIQITEAATILGVSLVDTSNNWCEGQG